MQQVCNKSQTNMWNSYATFDYRNKHLETYFLPKHLETHFLPNYNRLCNSFSLNTEDLNVFLGKMRACIAGGSMSWCFRPFSFSETYTGDIDVYLPFGVMSLPQMISCIETFCANHNYVVADGFTWHKQLKETSKPFDCVNPLHPTDIHPSTSYTCCSCNTPLCNYCNFNEDRDAVYCKECNLYVYQSVDISSQLSYHTRTVYDGVKSIRQVLEYHHSTDGSKRIQFIFTAIPIIYALHAVSEEFFDQFDLSCCSVFWCGKVLRVKNQKSLLQRIATINPRIDENQLPKKLIERVQKYFNRGFQITAKNVKLLDIVNCVEEKAQALKSILCQDVIDHVILPYLKADESCLHLDLDQKATSQYASEEDDIVNVDGVEDEEWDIDVTK